ncbi:acyltransferase family protein [Labrys okinawensis]|uniref:acyltransferase family protein n=1 Tax=Labrys okinawensis TaxID=346911 RepID=UPI0039BCB73D
MTDLAEHRGYVPAGTVGAKPMAPAATAAGHRLDIDGMRALAIVPVLFFHLGSEVLKGGYIGVDVFFVISGFLITGILQSEIQAGTFSLLHFYDRRIRRIFPALLAVLLASTILAVVLLLPPDILDFSRSGLAAALFSSNFYFMSATDYFNVAADSNPLLHTWSLAVEEQYYIVFPLLLWALGGAGRRWTLPVVALLALGSFVLSVVFVRSHQVAAFYMAPTRAWELLVGALLALGAVPKIEWAWLRETLAALGLALIVAGCLLFYKNMPFPGERALVPCIGAALLIHAGTSGPTLVGRLLSLRPLVFIGLISYSLYLWHWPIIIFFRIWSARPVGVGEGALLLVLSFAAAALSWRYIEQPFQRKAVAASPVVLRFSAAGGVAGLVVVWVGLLVSGGLASAFPAGVVRLAGYVHYEDEAVYRRGTCFLDSHANALADFDAGTCLARAPGKPAMLLIGDSHAAHLWRGLADELPGASILQMTASGCKPVLGGRGHPTCLALMQRGLEEETAKGGLDAVILSARWEAEDVPLLVATVDRLATRVPRIYVSGPIVEYRDALPRVLARAALDNTPGLLLSQRSDEPRAVDEMVKAALAGHRNVAYLSPYQTLCPQPMQACRTTVGDEVPMQWDYGHLTAEGADFLVKSWRDEGLL